MYAWPILLPAITNREDLLRTVSLFDDDTGQAIDLSGRTLAAPGDFTGSAWTVTDGAITTTSASTLTIKDYPFGNEMQAIALTVGVNLAILPGDAVTIADTPTGLNTMTGVVTSYVASSGAMVAQIGCAFDFEIRGHHEHHHDGGYSSNSMFAGVDHPFPIIRAQLGSGISVIDVGVIQILIPASTIMKLRAKTYSEALVLYNGPDTRQVYIGKLPTLYGGVSTAPFALPATSNPYGLP